MPNEAAYGVDIFFGQGRVRVRSSSDGLDVTAFLVQLEALDGDVWKAVRRYDDRHGAPHLDYLDRSGREYRKEWLGLDRNAALTLAHRDFMANGERYIEEFLEGDIDGKTFLLPDEERDRSAREIENFLKFTRDVLNEPTILEHIPDGSSVKTIPIAERDPNVRYDIETPRYLAIVTPPAPERTEPASRPNGLTRRIDRNTAARRRRIRAAHR